MNAPAQVKPQGRSIPSQYATEAGIPKDRAQRVCSNCAAQKLKCSGDQDGCQRCAQNELASFRHLQRRMQHPAAVMTNQLLVRNTPKTRPRDQLQSPRRASPLHRVKLHTRRPVVCLTDFIVRKTLSEHMQMPTLNVFIR
ncbi:hypothetical protein BDZ45DRAFT_259372 [Acephala macrosclerotiorum]|nr:hypothetical protein BDZ45DRAFT_259372 [Acephala macrosclerotiorum]